MDNARVPRDAYYLIEVTLRTDFKFKIASRGYNLKSWLDFQKTMDVKKVTYNEVTLEEYNKYAVFKANTEPSTAIRD
jgi:hypothetical protein